MPDTQSSDLIQALDGLRDGVAQKEKLIKTTLADFKNAAAITQKAAKRLPELAALNLGLNLPDASLFEAVKEQGIDPFRASLQRELRAYGKTLAALKTALGALRAEADVVRLSKAYAGLEALGQPEFARHLATFQDHLKQANDDLAFGFGKQLKAALGERGLSLEVNGSKYEIGRFEVEVNFNKRAAALRYGKDVVIPKVTLSVEGVLKAYDAADKLITQRGEDGAKWLELLYKAWEGLSRKQASREPSVNLMECYLELTVLRQGRNFRIEPSKRSFADYTRAQFAYDLDQFKGLKHNGNGVHLHVATKSQTDSPDRVIWLVTGDAPHDGKYMSAIVFEKES